MTYEDAAVLARHHMPFPGNRELELEDVERIAHLLPVTTSPQQLFDELKKRELTAIRR